jgi:hypothetical protein
MCKARWIMTVCAAVALSAGSARADIAKLINFQGRLTDAAGTALGGTHSIKFGIWDAASGGTKCFEETQASIAVTTGLFKVNVGAATSGGITACDFSKPYYLELTVDTDAAMTPRLPFTTAAYAFNADTLGGLHATSYQTREPATGNVYVSGKLGVGQASPTQAVDVTGYVQGTQLCINGGCRSAWPAGTVTSISAGTGITLSQSPLTTAGSISINTTAVQQRITGTCGSNLMKAVAANGTVTCKTVPSSVKCYYSGRVYSPGAVCYTGSASGTYCTSGKYEFTQNTCTSAGTWSVTSSSCALLPSSC